MEKYIDKIQDFLDGLLSEEERNSFEKELATNDELMEEVRMQKKLNEVIRSRIEASVRIDELKVSLAKNREKYFVSSISKIKNSLSTPKVFSLKKWTITIGVAACLLLGLNFLGVFSPSLNELPLLTSEVVRSSNNKNEVNDAIASFNAKNYNESIQLFTALTKKAPLNSRFQYYLALSYMGKKEWKDAKDTFIPIAEGNSIFREDAAYFTAVAALELEDKKLALAYAKRVSKDSQYYKKAQRIIKK